MVDISSLKNYMEVPDKFMRDYVKYELTTSTIEAFLDYTLKNLDCSRVWPNGMRPSQTISYIYIRELTQFIYTVNTYIEDEKEIDKYLIKVLELHNRNLEYEKINPPIQYEDKNGSKSVKCKVPKYKPQIEKQQHKETVAQRKLKEHAFKLSKLTLKLA